MHVLKKQYVFINFVKSKNIFLANIYQSQFEINFWKCQARNVLYNVHASDYRAL